MTRRKTKLNVAWAVGRPHVQIEVTEWLRIEAAYGCSLATTVRTGWSQPVNATLYLEGEMECALMGDRFHRGFTAAEKTELWDRWKRGESLKAIGRAFGKPSSSIY